MNDENVRYQDNHKKHIHLPFNSPTKSSRQKPFSITKKVTRISIDSNIRKNVFLRYDKDGKSGFSSAYQQQHSKPSAMNNSSYISSIGGRILKRVRSDVQNHNFVKKNGIFEKSAKLKVKKENGLKEDLSQNISAMINKMAQCVDKGDNKTNHINQNYDKMLSHVNLTKNRININCQRKSRKNGETNNPNKEVSFNSFTYKGNLKDSILILKENKNFMKNISFRDEYHDKETKENHILFTDNKVHKKMSNSFNTKFQISKIPNTDTKSKNLKELLKLRRLAKKSKGAYLTNLPNKPNPDTHNSFSSRFLRKLADRPFKFLDETYQQENRQRNEKQQMKSFVNFNKTQNLKGNKSISISNIKGPKPRKSALKKNKSNIIKKVTFAEHFNERHLVSKWLNQAEKDFKEEGFKSNRVILRDRLDQIKQKERLKLRSDNKTRRTIKLDEFTSIV